MGIIMPTDLTKIQTTRDKYEAILKREIAKLPKGHGISQAEIAGICKLSKKHFQSYGFTKDHNTVKHSGTIYFVK